MEFMSQSIGSSAVTMETVSGIWYSTVVYIYKPKGLYEKPKVHGSPAEMAKFPPHLWTKTKPQSESQQVITQDPCTPAVCWPATRCWPATVGKKKEEFVDLQLNLCCPATWGKILLCFDKIWYVTSTHKSRSLVLSMTIYLIRKIIP